MKEALADFLSQHQTAIIHRWTEKARRVQEPRTLPIKDLLNAFPLVFEEAVEALREREAGREAPEGGATVVTAREHGAQRKHLGYSPSELIHEYSLLRDSILEEIEEQGRTFSQREYWALWETFTTVIAESTEAYVREQAGQYLAFLAHEIRNPLASAKVAVALHKKVCPVPNEPHLSALEKTLKRVSDLIDGSLVEVRLRSGVALRTEQRSLSELLAATAEDAALVAEARHIQLKLVADEGVMLRVDPKVLLSALTNLVRNAIKFTHDDGTVTIREHAEGDGIRIEVEDECGGLPPGAAERMFAPFVQIGGDSTGFGLGLTIAKQAVDAHGGQIGVRDLPHQGCVFSIDLPGEDVVHPQ